MNEQYALKHPFGEESCEAELKILKSNYQKYYFDETPFNSASLDEDCYLIVGRRGTGKTSLAHHFSFQQQIPNARCIDIDEPDAYSNVLTKISRFSAADANIAIPRITKIWEYVFWTLIFSKFKNESPEIKAACISTESKGSFFIKSVLTHIIKRFLPDDCQFLSEQLEDFISSKAVEVAKEKMLEIAAETPVILAMDSLEKYAIDNQDVMMSLAALIQCSSNFNVEYSSRGIHVKTFVSAEVFPYLTETAIANPIKYVRDPVFMQWRPKDLMRLTCWRFFSHLKSNNQLHPHAKHTIDWSDYNDVLENVWIPYFGEHITNGTGITEKTFPYVLRHTQMRPRQIVVLCNAIAKRAQNGKYFPYFGERPDELIDVVNATEISLANGVINAYSSVYPNVNKILDALSGTPTIFRGSWLDKIAKRTASEWPFGDYSPTRFRQIVAELGIVGVIRKWSEDAQIIEADFEYTMADRLAVTSEDECVLHPMFYQKFRAEIEQPAIVYPFPNHPDFSPIRS